MPTATKPAVESPAATLPVDTLLKWLRDMLLIREFEVRAMQSYQNRKVGGFCHIYSGQEAVAVGCTAALQKGDPVITAYRDHGQALASGMDPKYCMAEMYGKIGGCAKGKGGSMHMFDKANDLYGGHGIVGAHTPLAAGLAFATKYEDEVLNRGKSSRVTLCLLGDGALNQGAFHEAMNLAGIFDLPVLYVCENNGYAMGTAVERGTSMAHDLSVKAQAYGMENATIGGLDVLEVYNGMHPLVERCRESSRPIFVNMPTYRFKGHSMSDPRKYRTKEEESEYESKDPINALTAYLQTHHDFSEDDYNQLNNEVRTQIREAIEWADESPDPDPEEELFKDVYIEQWGPYNGTSLPPMLRSPSDEQESENA